MYHKKPKLSFLTYLVQLKKIFKLPDSQNLIYIIYYQEIRPTYETSNWKVTDWKRRPFKVGQSIDMCLERGFMLWGLNEMKNGLCSQSLKSIQEHKRDFGGNN